MEQAKVKYNTRLKARLVDIEQLHADIKRHQQELAKNQQELAKNQQELAKNKQELAKNQQELAKSKEELDKSKEELDKVNQQMIDILNKVSTQDVKSKENIRQMVVEAKALFFKSKVEINPHIDELFTLVP